jgi:hypothetical protein
VDLLGDNILLGAVNKNTEILMNTSKRNNIKKDFRELRWGCCEHGNEPLGSINCWEILE